VRVDIRARRWVFALSSQSLTLLAAFSVRLAHTAPTSTSTSSCALPPPACALSSLLSYLLHRLASRERRHHHRTCEIKNTNAKTAAPKRKQKLFIRGQGRRACRDAPLSLLLFDIIMVIIVSCCECFVQREEGRRPS
jgi:hypothetical protein